MVDAARHPNVDIRAYTEVDRVDGYIGNFRVKLIEKPRYVVADRCTGCGACSPVCPIEVPNEFEESLGPRKAIYVPHSQTVPLVYTIDMDACIECYKCVEECGNLEAIDFSQEPKEVWEDMCAANWGRIVNITSIAGLMGGSGQTSYGAAKAGLVGLSKATAIEGAKFNITSNVVVVGLADTDAPLVKEATESLGKRILWKRPAEPEEIANSVAYLASEEARYMTGAEMNMMGGLDLFVV